MKALPFPRLLTFTLALISSTILLRADEAKPAPPIAVSVDHADALYHKGETVTFHIKATPEAALAPDAEIAWTISKDGVPPTKSGKVTLTAGAADVTAQLDEPGFLQCRATVKVGDQSVTAMAGAGVDPTQIAPSMPIPADFDEFWKAQKARLAAVPMRAILTPVTVTQKNVEAFDVQVDAVGSVTSGYFARPAKAEPKSLPAILFVQGAGVRSSGLNGPAGWATSGVLAMDINAHGLPNGKPDEFYKALADGELKEYRTAGHESRETVYFLNMFLRELRALDFLCSQPEWDGKTLIVYGGSQGGFQAFAGAALDDRVTFFAAGVPAGSDHTGMVAGRVAGWPKLVPIVGGQPDPKSLEAARYFDNVNFAIRTKAKGAVVTTGFIDTTCPPSSVYAAYNAIPFTNKKIYNDIPSGHATGPAAGAFMNDAVRAYLKSVQPAAK